MQILNLIRIEAVPQKHGELEQTLLSMADKIRKIKGCVSHHLYADLEKSGTLCVADKWESKEDFDAYLDSDLFRVLIGAAGVLGKSHDRMTFTSVSR
ncbi:MAG: antibiotic biosynthesis monooxygenase [Deltaproteobacteria bacterium]|nr:antibiotic biosynthesis monooxygenase [Deltaproteobacteria bacterium]MBW1819411.1 antibiotic biosynthesis monooxygenase [Deltaproteobacteria bacterium]MBW2285223.1 antibiotic biosynthesis monooxygenase [Deltaproteobacteria bacterium]